MRGRDTEKRRGLRAIRRATRVWIAAVIALVIGCKRGRPEETGAGRTVRDANGHAVIVRDVSRIVSAGGAITETLFALGAGAHVVGTDSSSTYPDEATRRTQVGYVRMLAAEGLLALSPTLVITTTDAGPPAVMQQLRDAGLTLLVLPSTPSLEGARARIRGVAEALDRVKEGEALIAQLDADLAAVPSATTPRRKVLFVYARGGGTLNVSGKGTAADEMIRLAGAENAVTGYDGYKPLTAEAVVTAAPDVIVFTEKGLAGVGGVDAALALPGIALTPAGRARAIVAMDDLFLLGFGPRTGRAVQALAQLLRAP